MDDIHSPSTTLDDDNDDYLINYSVLSSLRPLSQNHERINLSSMDDIHSPFTTLDDDNDDVQVIDLNLNSGELYTIKTKFNPLKDGNVKVDYSNENCDIFTQKERKFAMKATHCDSLEDLSQKVGDSHSPLLLNFSDMKVFFFSLENSYNLGRKLEKIFEYNSC